MNLEQRHEGSSFRHYLDDKPVHCGASLMLLVRESLYPKDWIWTHARYEIAGNISTGQVVLYCSFGRVIPTQDTLLRWPTEGER